MRFWVVWCDEMTTPIRVCFFRHLCACVGCDQRQRQHTSKFDLFCHISHVNGEKVRVMGSTCLLNQHCKTKMRFWVSSCVATRDDKTHLSLLFFNLVSHANGGKVRWTGQPASKMKMASPVEITTTIWIWFFWRRNSVVWDQRWQHKVKFSFFWQHIQHRWRESGGNLVWVWSLSLLSQSEGSCFYLVSHCDPSMLSQKWKPISLRDKKIWNKSYLSLLNGSQYGSTNVWIWRHFGISLFYLQYGNGTISWTLLPLSKNNKNPIVALTAGLGLLFNAWQGATYKYPILRPCHSKSCSMRKSLLQTRARNTAQNWSYGTLKYPAREGVPIGNESLKPMVNSKCHTSRTPIWESASTSPRQLWNACKDNIESCPPLSSTYRRRSPKDELMTGTTVGAQHDGWTSCWSI
jgi:hypothetical protein